VSTATLTWEEQRQARLAAEIRSYDKALAFIGGGKNGSYRPANGASNTRFILHDDGRITLRYRLTDVVTYYRDGRIGLRADGWLTQTTARRWDDFTPFRQVSINGRWCIVANPDYTGPNWTLGGTPFVEDLTFARDRNGRWHPENELPAETVAEQDERNRAMRRLVNSALRQVKWDGDAGTTGCPRCEATITNGQDPDPETRRSHMLDHVLRVRTTGNLTRSLCQLIIRERGYSSHWTMPRREWARDYLLRHLLDGAVGMKHGRAPANAKVGSTHRGGGF
jgi:hypothetical protein